MVSILVVDRMVVANPVIWTMLDSMNVVMLVNMLGVMLTLIFIREVVTQVMGALRLNIVIFTMLFACKMTLVTNVWLMVTEVPVTLLEMGSRVMLFTMHHHNIAMTILGVRMLKGCLFSNQVVGCEVRLAAALRWSRGLLCLFLRRQIVHLFVEKGGIWAHVLLSVSLGSRGFLVMIRAVVVRIVRHLFLMLTLTHATMRELFHRLEWAVRHLISLGSIGVSVSPVGIIALVVTGIGAWTIWVRGRKRWHTTIFAWVLTCTLHMAIVLLGGNIIMLITLLGLLALGNGVLRCWLSLSRHDLSRLKPMHAVQLLS